MRKTNKTNTYESKTNDSVSLEMSNAQDTFVPHWIIRFSSDFVADALTTAKDDNFKKVTKRDEFINAVSHALNVAYGCSLDVKEYDFGAKKSRSEIIAKLEAKADTTKSDLKPYVQAIKNALDAGTVNAENFNARLKAMCEAHKLNQAQHDTLKAMFPVSAPAQKVVF